MTGPHSGKRKAITFDTKKEVIKRKQEGQGNSAIGRAMGLSESTVRTIWKHKDEILQSIKAYGSSKLDTRKRAPDVAVIRMERYLNVWINRKESEGVPLDKKQIMDMAMSFYHTICKKYGGQRGAFKASTGWLYRFLGRKDIRNVKLTGESASADTVAANNFPSVLKEIINEGGYVPDCIYNMDEAGLQYKKMPRSTFLAKQIKQARGRKADKNRFTVLFCCNLTGTHKMKPLIVHTAKHPRCYRHLADMSKAPVYWKMTQNGWMNSITTQSWLLETFVPDARWKCRQLGVPFKVLLIMDNCPAHPVYLDDLHPKVKVVFLPPNTTSVMQPLDQEVIGNIKTFYQMRVYAVMRQETESGVEIQQIIDEADNNDEDIDPPQTSGELAVPEVRDQAHPQTDEDDPDDPLADPQSDASTPHSQPNPQAMTVQQFWRQFTIKDAIDHLLKAWGDINEATVRRSWQKLVPHLVNERESEQRQLLCDTVAQAVEVARHVPGFSDVSAEEIQEINSVGDHMTPEGIISAASVEDQLEEEMRPQPTQETPHELSMQQLSRILGGVDALQDIVNENEVSKIRKTEFSLNLKQLIRYYKDLYNDKVNERKQTLITKFLRPAVPVTAPAHEPQPGPSHQDNDVASVVSDHDFEGFMEEVEEARRSGEIPAHESDDDAAPPGDSAGSQ